MKECRFCGYIGSEWGITYKKKALVFSCPICSGLECKTSSLYQRRDFEYFDDLLDFLNLNEVKPEHIITIEQWALGFALLFFTE